MDTYTEHRKVTRDVLDFRTEPWLPSSDGSGVIPPSHSNLASLGYKESNHIEFASQQALAITNQQLNEIASDAFMDKKTIISQDTDWNTITSPGSHKVNNLDGKNAPIGYAYGVLEVTRSIDCIEQKYFTHIGDIFHRQRYNNTWVGWKRLPTQDKIDILLPLNSQYLNTTHSMSDLSRTNNSVTIFARVKKADGSIIAGIVPIATVPVMYRPAAVRGNINRFIDTILLSGEGLSEVIGTTLAYVDTGNGSLSVIIPHTMSNVRSIFIPEQVMEI